MVAAAASPEQIEILEIDPLTAPEVDLAAVWALSCALDREALPDEPVAPFEHMLRSYRRSMPNRYRRWFVARGGGELLGWCVCSWTDLPENRTHADVDVMVAPAARRRGLGTLLVTRALQAARAAGCTLLDIACRVGGPGEPFLRAIGAELRCVERRSSCRTADLDRGLLAGWVARAGERAAGYSLVSWDGPCPDELLPAFTALKDVMNTAPLEGLDWDDEHLTPQRCRDVEAAWIERGFEWWTVCARHDGSGELAGFTELYFPATWPEMAYQEDTGVWPKHRERGLGRWLKAALALRLLDERPGVQRIETWNAGSNEAMLGINVAMGFRPLENWGDWQVTTERATEALALRP